MSGLDSFIDSLSDSVNDGIAFLNDYFWGISFVFLIGLGLIFTYKLKGLQIAKIRETSRLALSGVSEGRKTNKISSFEAFCIGMGARIGVGNIAGVATAIVTGGPGAVFWMWIFAIIGSASSFMESTLAQIYKERKGDGHFYGGPAYYASKGLGNRNLGILAAILLVLTFGIGFVAVQSTNASNALCGAFEFDNNHIVFALIIAAIAALIIFRGLKAAAKFSAGVVPYMALLWLVFAVVLICFNLGGVPHAFKMIFEYAFTVPSALGGMIGTVVLTGLKRGVFSNEAGLGSVANVAATADVKHPIKQGMIQSFGVLVDTLIVCTFTAVVILSYGNFESILAFGEKGSVLVQSIASESVGNDITNYIIALFMFIFAFTSLIGYYTMSESNARFIKDDKRVINCIRLLVIAVAFCAACVEDVSLVDSFSDTFMAAMAAVNMTIVALLSRKVFEAYRDYRKQKAEGVEEPVFHKDALSDSTGVTEWD
ncbi:amino acid carrier protein [Candidatus Methanomethylophilus sp. 1R26]|uniref:alanine/glycine:cation symporter family protein n=1 Tax=Candidatus Methanomethylophilus sp. 1R26 TaxID=1769296 RepID=UPI0007376A83|nr:alanine/glycine:cation symporter family protein [Candidatus Methanomethylophilus sp. 1R26]KUE73578.1 amino acid carrier protein [Candidatus Methanomethylophilus sp. 1R26]TQS78908.1 MAG: amino acid carrier protein [Methanomethylophilus alvi]WII09468.1 alanine/glycine:cation symporter family protein [Methanomassiliicoccales archaeon LGM-DZ1]